MEKRKEKSTDKPKVIHAGDVVEINYLGDDPIRNVMAILLSPLRIKPGDKGLTIRIAYGYDLDHNMMLPDTFRWASSERSQICTVTSRRRKNWYFRNIEESIKPKQLFNNSKKS